MDRIFVRYSYLLAGCFFILGWILPNHYFPWSTAYQEFASFLAIIVLVLGLLFSGVIRVPYCFLFVFFLAVIPLFQYAFGIIYFFGDALLASLYIAGFFAALLVGYVCLRGVLGYGYLLNILAASLLLGAILSLWIALRQWLLLSGSIWIVDFPVGARPFANLAQPNNLATLLSMGVAAILYFYERGVLGRLSVGVLAVSLFFGIALTQSRTPWVALLIMTLFWFWKSKVYNFKIGFGMICAWLAYYVLCVLVLPSISDILMLHSNDLAAHAQSFERLALWEQFWHAIWQGSLWGYGWTQVNLAQIQMSLAYPVPILTEHSHNIILDLMLWNGPVLGLMIVCFFTFWLLRMAWYARTLESFFALSASGFLLIHGLLELPLEYAFFLMPLGVLLGSVAAEYSCARVFFIPRRIIIFAIFICIVIFIAVWREYRVLEEDYRLMRFEEAHIGFLKAEHPAPNVILLTQIREFLRFARTEPAENMSDSQLELVRKVAYSPPYAPSLVRYAVSLGLNGEEKKAFEQLQLLRSLHGEIAYKNSMSYLMQLQSTYPQLGKVLKEEQNRGMAD